MNTGVHSRGPMHAQKDPTLHEAPHSAAGIGEGVAADECEAAWDGAPAWKSPAHTQHSSLCGRFALCAEERRRHSHPAGWDPDTLVFWKHCVAVICLSILTLLCGLFMPKIQTVLGFAGAITGGSIDFLLPVLFVMYSGDWTWRNVGSFHYICAYIMLFAGVIGIVFGTGATVNGTASG